MASRRIWLDGRELKPGPSQNVWNHSPDGFNWGYGGSGPAQLALAVCLALTGDRDVALLLHQPFKRSVIAIVPQHDIDIWFDWDLTRQPMWTFLGRLCIEAIPEPAIEAKPGNPATQERSEGVFVRQAGLARACRGCPHKTRRVGSGGCEGCIWNGVLEEDEHASV
jgi:hypothetical protein